MTYAACRLRGGREGSERLAALPVILWSKVQVAPGCAMAIAGMEQYPRDL